MKVITHIAPRAARGKNLTIVWGAHDFPVGKILVALTAEGLCWLGIDCGVNKLRENWKGAELVEDKAVTAEAAREIARLWPHGLDRLSVPVVLYGTAFQLKVWKELLKIKSGDTVTYAHIARRIGKPAAVRAVGSAVGKNTVSIVVPCHRVLNKDSGKINYGWGPKIKIALLKGEKAA
ncbi:MAG: methylated-DNA--[protein]-cysteine S-methyltransferase [Alphaproteobacteria bacterium]|nr:methylated-DNA--[protein]-cysteine S-methyltransferase [Alphaproteobacteria bacterium]